MKASARIRNLPQSPIRALLPFAAAAKARGVHVYHLNIGQPDIRTPGIMLDVLKRASIEILGYGPAEGLPSYRKALVDYYRHHALPVEDADLLVTTGGSEALLMAFMAICDPGDTVLAPEPYYANFSGFLGALCATLTPLTCRAEEGFHLPDDAALEAALRPAMKAILYSSPGNPTGCVYHRRELERLFAFAARHDLAVIADETYREFVYTDAPFVSALDFPEHWARTLVVDSISKRYSACGARVGSLVVKNPELNAQLRKYAQVRLCPPTLGQMLASATVAHLDEYVGQVKAEYRARRDFCHQRLNRMPGVNCDLPEGAFYMIVSLPVDDATRFARWLLEDFSHEGATVMFAPAQGFYATPGLGTRQVRLAYVLGREDLGRALDVLETGLKAYPQRSEQAAASR